ncbi:Conserved oligomeric Golgi complex subunit 2-like [Mycena chlorophos]|uniref:Conserved oligomeric Golgi complex subunit 2-like n=1 Tax=Mycena chlorophos TaxID=658473 RepID=A0A8H6W7J1_MYCCL|nr:Conserved oligomeric Golgi complex subunit 2-like [Mycena chlorophos]
MSSTSGQRQCGGAGEVIVAMQSPNGVEFSDIFGTRGSCASCGQLRTKRNALKVCSGCHYFFYCGRECQKSHWQGLHKYACIPEYELLDPQNGLDKYTLHVPPDVLNNELFVVQLRQKPEFNITERNIRKAFQVEGARMCPDTAVERVYGGLSRIEGLKQAVIDQAPKGPTTLRIIILVDFVDQETGNVIRRATIYSMDMHTLFWPCWGYNTLNKALGKALHRDWCGHFRSHIREGKDTAFLAHLVRTRFKVEGGMSVRVTNSLLNKMSVALADEPHVGSDYDFRLLKNAYERYRLEPDFDADEKGPYSGDPMREVFSPALILRWRFHPQPVNHISPADIQPEGLYLDDQMREVFSPALILRWRCFHRWLWRDAEHVLRRDVVRRTAVYISRRAHGSTFAHCPTTMKSAAPGSALPPRTPYMHFSSRTPLRFNYSTSTFPYAHLLEDPEDHLARLYNQILTFVERDMTTVMGLAEKIVLKPKPVRKDRSLDGFQIMGNVVWEELGRSIMDELGLVVFAAGRPNEFRKHYEITQAFIRSLEFLAPSAQAVEAMRAHHVYVASVGKMEEALANPRVELIKAESQEAFDSVQAAAFWVAITACWSAEVFVPELSHRFWRLTLQFLSRYKTWLVNSLIPDDQQSIIAPTDRQTAESAAADDAIRKQYASILVDAL